MKEFKQLDRSRNSQIDIINADPYGLEFKYLISVQANKKFKFAIVNSLYECLSEFPQICSSIKIAKEQATQHLFSLLGNVTF